MDKWDCRGVVERTTDYVEGSLGVDDLARMITHLHSCRGCAAYLSEIRVTRLLLSDLPPERVSDDVESSLLHRYRERTASVSL